MKRPTDRFHPLPRPLCADEIKLVGGGSVNVLGVIVTWDTAGKVTSVSRS